MDFSKRITKKKLGEFVEFAERTNRMIGFKVSARGWCYIAEQYGIITKAEFDKVEGLINRCRKEGLLPVDFVAEEAAREFKEVHKPTSESVDYFISGWLEAAAECAGFYDPDWWEGEEYYIQMIVEKIDLVTLFQPVCARYHIPIANTKGWSSILQRAEYSRRFKLAERKGLKCVLLYCGDHDPDGLRISDILRKNIEDVKNIRWSGGLSGYDPENLIIERFGLNRDFIRANGLTWIDNLITGSKKDLANPRHPNYKLPYLQTYLKEVGVRKCEANSLVIRPEAGRQLCEDTIVKYLGEDAEARFDARKEEAVQRVQDRMNEIGVAEPINDAIDQLNS